MPHTKCSSSGMASGPKVSRQSSVNFATEPKGLPPKPKLCMAIRMPYLSEKLSSLESLKKVKVHVGADIDEGAGHRGFRHIQEQENGSAPKPERNSNLLKSIEIY